MPKVSILLPVYNEEPFLKEALDSVLNQTFSDWELLVVDDGSTDNSVNIIREFSALDKRIALIRNETNLGLIASLNKAIRLSKGEFLARIDGDDIWINKEKLAKQVDFMDSNPDTVLLGTAATLIDEQGAIVRALTVPLRHETIVRKLAIHNCFIHTSVLMRKSAAQKAGFYSAYAVHAEDYDLWLKMGKIGKLANLPESLVCYRDNPKGVSRTNSLKQMKMVLKVLWKNKKEYPKSYIGILKLNFQLCFLAIFGKRGYDWFKEKISLIYGAKQEK